MSRTLVQWFAASALVCFAVVAIAADVPQGLDQTGKPDLKSAGPLTFGPEGVLFVGDPQGAALFAIAAPAAKAAGPAVFKLEGIDAKVAALIGAKAADILINDMAVQPGTGLASGSRPPPGRARVAMASSARAARSTTTSPAPTAT